MAHIGKRAITVVAKELGMAEIADEEIRQPAVAEVAPGSTEAGPRRGEPRSCSNVCEGAVAVVMEETVGGLAIKEATQVVGDEEVEVSVSVVVDPGRDEARPPYIQTRFLGDVSEGPVTVIAH